MRSFIIHWIVSRLYEEIEAEKVMTTKPFLSKMKVFGAIIVVILVKWSNHTDAFKGNGRKIEESKNKFNAHWIEIL